MNSSEVAILGFILLFPVVDFINEKYKSNNKIFEYLKIASFIWLPTLFLFYLYSDNKLSVVDFGFHIENNWQNILFISLLFIAIIYLFLLIRSIISSEELRTAIKTKTESFKDLLPETKNEMLVFTLIVSVTAGICEELIFRAYLFTLIDNHMGIVAAIVLSSIIFGLWHIYLGWQEVIRTSVMGSIFCGIYIITGNIIIPILIHIFVDVYSGLMFYFAVRKSDKIIN
ncbi:CPBP family intramembrane glutamic endopeptidase [Pseudocolwellia agarivorans]|uniref:CPBP family intramembrane glutamic endopeptidase n=1 Tax=Pseudocolwellia agarivorans TaxID=1911682 RepID=UPI003F880C0D